MTDWFSGSLWRVAVTAAAGVLVGVLRLPAKPAGTLTEIGTSQLAPVAIPARLLDFTQSVVTVSGGIDRHALIVPTERAAARAGGIA